MPTKLVVGGTGHRPDKLGKIYDPYSSSPIRQRIKRELYYSLLNLEADVVITGMALGVDQWLAEVSMELSIPFIAAIPCQQQEKLWSRANKEHYWALLKNAWKVELVTDAPYEPRLMQVRNEWIVDHSDILLAVWDGSSGGTKNCIDYALHVGMQWDKEIIRITP